MDPNDIARTEDGGTSSLQDINFQEPAVHVLQEPVRALGAQSEATEHTQPVEQLMGELTLNQNRNKEKEKAEYDTDSGSSSSCSIPIDATNSSGEIEIDNYYLDGCRLQE